MLFFVLLDVCSVMAFQNENVFQWLSGWAVRSVSCCFFVRSMLMVEAFNLKQQNENKNRLDIKTMLSLACCRPYIYWYMYVSKWREKVDVLETKRGKKTNILTMMNYIFACIYLYILNIRSFYFLFIFFFFPLIVCIVLLASIQNNFQYRTKGTYNKAKAVKVMDYIDHFTYWSHIYFCHIFTIHATTKKSKENLLIHDTHEQYRQKKTCRLIENRILSRLWIHIQYTLYSHTKTLWIRLIIAVRFFRFRKM